MAIGWLLDGYWMAVEWLLNGCHGAPLNDELPKEAQGRGHKTEHGQARPPGARPGPSQSTKHNAVSTYIAKLGLPSQQARPKSERQTQDRLTVYGQAGRSQRRPGPSLSINSRADYVILSWASTAHCAAATMATAAQGISGLAVTRRGAYFIAFSQEMKGARVP